MVAWQTIGTGAAERQTVFEIDRFAAVKVSPADLKPFQERATSHDAGPYSALGLKQGDFQPPKLSDVASQKQAEDAMGYRLRLPAFLPSNVSNAPHWAVLSPVSYTVTIDSSKWQALCQVLGLGQAPVPPALDGANLTFATQPSAVVSYGDGTPSLVLGQGKSPSLAVPSRIDVDAIRDLLLTSPLVQPELASQLRAIRDWKSTAVIPITPESESSEVQVDGVTGLFVKPKGQEGALILWQKNSILYVLFGKLGEPDLLKVANSLS